MSIDLAMNNLSGILTEATEDENSVCYVTEDDAETLKVAIEVMRKYQKIQEIYERFQKDGDYYHHMAWLDVMEVIDNGNVD